MHGRHEFVHSHFHFGKKTSCCCCCFALSAGVAALDLLAVALKPYKRPWLCPWPAKQFPRQAAPCVKKCHGSRVHLRAVEEDLRVHDFTRDVGPAWFDSVMVEECPRSCRPNSRKNRCLPVPSPVSTRCASPWQSPPRE